MLPIKCWYRDEPAHYASSKWLPGKCMGWVGQPTYAVVRRQDGSCTTVTLSAIRFGSKPSSKKKPKKKGKSK